MVALFSAVVVLACNNEAGNDTATDTAAGNPATVQPPSEAIPESTQLVNDSVVVPRTAPTSGSGATGDTTPR